MPNSPSPGTSGSPGGPFLHACLPFSETEHGRDGGGRPLRCRGRPSRCRVCTQDARVDPQTNERSQPPPVPPQWSADLAYDGFLAGLELRDGRGTFSYDREGKRYRSSYSSSCGYFRPNATAWQDQLTVGLPDGTASSNYTWGEGDNATCLPWPPAAKACVSASGAGWEVLSRRSLGLVAIKRGAT